jgi:hypothetical protein
LPFSRETIEFEKLVAGKPLRCRVEVFPGYASLCADGAEVIFQADPDFRERAIRLAETLGYVRVAPPPAG